MNIRNIKKEVLKITKSIGVGIIIIILTKIFSPTEQTWEGFRKMLKANISTIIIIIGILIIAGMWVYWWIIDQKREKLEADKKKKVLYEYLLEEIRKAEIAARSNFQAYQAIEEYIRKRDGSTIPKSDANLSEELAKILTNFHMDSMALIDQKAFDNIKTDFK